MCKSDNLVGNNDTVGTTSLGEQLVLGEQSMVCSSENAPDGVVTLDPSPVEQSDIQSDEQTVHGLGLGLEHNADLDSETARALAESVNEDLRRLLLHPAYSTDRHRARTAEEVYNKTMRNHLYNVPTLAGKTGTSSAFVQSLINLMGWPSMPMKHAFRISREQIKTYRPLMLYMRALVPLLPEDEQSRLMSMLRIFAKPLSSVNSEHMLLKYLRKRKLYHDPTRVILNRITRYKNNLPRRVNLSAEYIPLGKVLQAFLSLPNVLDTIIENLRPSTDGKIRKFIDGELWKKNKVVLANTDPNVIFVPLLNYYDDFETCNPLGNPPS